MASKLMKIKEVLRKNLERPYQVHKHYSISGNGVAYRKASDYLKDSKVNSFLKEAEKEAVSN